MARYVLDRRIGEGGMAEVFLAHTEGPGGFVRRAAVKRLLPTLVKDKELHTRFIDEARIAATLDHACIVTVFDFYEVRGVHHLAMEFVDGISAQELHARGLRGRFVSARVAGYIAHELARALEHAHSRGVLHRDVSLCNVLLARDGAVKLADFGLAKAAEKLWTSEPGSVSGKAGYLSPERKRGAEAVPADDLYALGMSLGHLLSAGDPRKPNEPGRAPLEGLRRRLVHPDRAERITAATALLEELRRVPLAAPETLAAALDEKTPLPTGPRRRMRAEELDDTTDAARNDTRDDDEERTVIEPTPRGSR